jgi:uncharacterized protein (TIGR03067 family)
MRILCGLAAAWVGSFSTTLAQSPAVVPTAATVPTGAADDSIAEELKKLQGYWKPQSVIYNDAEQIPDAKARSLLTMVVTGSEFRTYYCRDVERDIHFRLFTADLTLDPTHHTFELTVRDGQKKGERRHGIYRLEGSTLTLCYGPIERPRPTEFAAPKGSGVFLETWTVEKK